MTFQKLFCLNIEPVGKGLRIRHTEGIYVREAIIPGAPGGKHRIKSHWQSLPGQMNLSLEILRRTLVHYPV